MSVGTDHHRFDRLSGWVDAAARRVPELDVFMQSGTSDPPRLAASAPYLPYDEMRRRMLEADAIVCHGGPATIIEARAAGHVPLVVPRRPDLAEHVDDHQVRFCTWMDARGQVRVARTADELVAAFAGVVRRPSSGSSPGDAATPDRLPRGVVEFDAIVSAFLRAGR